MVALHICRAIFILGGNIMTHDELVLRINELTKISKERDLTKEEQAERKTLRDDYVGRVKRNLRSSLEGIKKK